jgi:hypothetical protein
MKRKSAIDVPDEKKRPRSCLRGRIVIASLE